MSEKSTMLFIDAEWNGYRGDLISLACVSAFGQEFYEVLPCEKPSSEWIRQHVLLNANKSAVSLYEFRCKFQAYLLQFKSVVVVADWPEDFEHFLKLLVVGPGKRLETPALQFKLVDGYADTSATSKVPHNALEDARALRISVMLARMKKRRTNERLLLSSNSY